MRCLPALVIGFILVGVAFFHAPVVAGIDKDPYLAGIEALKAGDLDKAIGFLSEAISRNPNDHRYYNDRGVAYKRSGNLELAMSDYGKALEIKPEYANAWNNRGVVYLAQGRYDEAINDLAKALRYGGLDDKVYVNMGCAYAQKGDYASALDQFNKAVAVGSTDHRVFVLMGETLEQMGASERALKVYQLAMDLAQDRQAADEIEKRISTLQKGMPAPGPDRRESSAQVDRAIQPSSSREGPSGDNEKAKQAPVTREAQARKIVRARPLSEPTPAPDAGVGRSVEKGVENYEELASRCQSRALTRLSQQSAEILSQGKHFLEKSDPTKALIRFEDTRQLEKRKKNYYGVAWSNREIAGALSKMGDYDRATTYLKEAAKLFEQLKANEECVLVLMELASTELLTGQRDRAATSYAKALEKAASINQEAVQSTSGDTANHKPQSTTQSKQSASGHPSPVSTAVAVPVTKRDERTGPPTAAKRTDELEKADTAPVTQSENEGKTAQAAAIATPKEQPGPAAPPPRDLPQGKPEGAVLAAKDTGIPKKMESKEKQIALKDTVKRPDFRKDMEELKRLQDNNDEPGMIVVLERLATHYVAKKEYDKALHCLDASLGLRDRLGQVQGLAAALRQRGEIEEKLGRRVEALEDFTRALANIRELSDESQRALMAQAGKLATEMGLDEKDVLEAFGVLWKARGQGDGHAETRALHRVGQLYDRAGLGNHALKYYERTTASMLADKAQSYSRIGLADLAEKSYTQALEAFRDLDYSRYEELKRKKVLPNTVSRSPGFGR